jgi:2-keto-3-deoxy-L-rhamnonate aldolase RhmA
MGFAGNPDLVRSYVESGFSSIAYGLDVMMMKSAYDSALAEIEKCL